MSDDKPTLAEILQSIDQRLAWIEKQQLYTIIVVSLFILLWAFKGAIPAALKMFGA